MRTTLVRRSCRSRPTDGHDGSAVEETHYNLEARVRIVSDDDFGREHLLRYRARRCRPFASLSLAGLDIASKKTS